MSNHVHSRQPFDPRTEDAHYRNNSRESREPRERSRDDRDRGRDDREGPRKRWDKDLKKNPADRRREDDRRRDDRDPWDWRDRRDDRDWQDDNSYRKSPKGQTTSTQRPGHLSESRVSEDVLWEANSLQSSMTPLSPKSPKESSGSTRRRPPRNTSPNQRDNGSSNQVDDNNDFVEVTQNINYASIDSFDSQYKKWLELAELGELDVYTCLGLSDASTWTVGTQSLVFKILTALVLQCLCPLCMLYLQFISIDTDPAAEEPGGNFLTEKIAQLKDHLKPASNSMHFRMIGCAMLLYTLYSMYNGALDECRSSLLHYCIQRNVNYGIWWPCLLGEVANLLVSGVLISTLYFLFVQTSDGPYLVLNAVGVNFLCDIDQEFVDRDIFENATHNFKTLLERYKDRPINERNYCGRALEALLSLARVLFICLGTVLAFLFLFAPDRNGGMWYLDLMSNSTNTDM